MFTYTDKLFHFLPEWCSHLEIAVEPFVPARAFNLYGSGIGPT